MKQPNQECHARDTSAGSRQDLFTQFSAAARQQVAPVLKPEALLLCKVDAASRRAFDRGFSICCKLLICPAEASMLRGAASDNAAAYGCKAYREQQQCIAALLVTAAQASSSRVTL